MMSSGRAAALFSAAAVILTVAVGRAAACARERRCLKNGDRSGGGCKHANKCARARLRHRLAAHSDDKSDRIFELQKTRR